MAGFTYYSFKTGIQFFVQLGFDEIDTVMSNSILIYVNMVHRIYTERYDLRPNEIKENYIGNREI
jgi:hypothetical protein